MIVNATAKTVLEGVSFDLRVEEVNAIRAAIKTVREAQDLVTTVLDNVSNPKCLNDFETELDITANTLATLLEGYVEV